MKSEEIFNRIESILNDKMNHSGNPETEPGTENRSAKNEIKDIAYLLMQLALNILKAPFKIAAKYFINEIVDAAKNDARLYMLLMGIMGVLFVFFSVMWLFVSVAVGVYFYDKGNTIFVSTIYSIGFQLISFILIALIALFASKKLKSLKVLKKLNK